MTSAQTLDNVSYLQGRLNYSDVNFQIKVNGATDIPQYVLPQDAISESLSLNAGTNTITLYAEDNAGNLSSCQFNVMVLDTIAPVARCKDAVIFADPSGTVITQIDPTIFDDESMDNCRITDRFTLPASISCNDIGDDRVITLYVKDEFENVDSCSSHVRIFTKEIKPTYSSGLCANDTLKFKANVETADKSLLSYHWVGPNSIEFFTENPEVPNATTIYNGTYILTVTGYNGCTAQGSVVVNINPITKPIVTPSNAIFCEEEQVVLSATDYSGNITYKWYEGIYPTGILIAENSNNEIMVTPIIGVHFYYVIVDGPNCVSDPSAVVKITVLKQPIVAVDDTFLTPCEGDNITFSTSVSNPNYSFMWSGPSGYAHLGQTPPMISNVTKANEGKYLLVIKNGECVSDTAAIIVTVFERPPAPTITGNAVFCKNGNMILTSSNASNADKFEWILNGTVFRVTQQNILNLTDVQSNFEGEWQVRAIKGNCASPLSQSKNVTIEDLTDVSVSYDGPICEGDSLQLLASFIPDASYKWQGPITNIPNVFNPKTLGKTGVYVVTISTPSGCTNSVSTSVDITSVPKVTALSHDGNLCMDEGDEIILSPSVFPDDPSYSYQWAGPNGFTSSDRNPVIAPITQIKSGEYSLIVGNHGCNSEASTLDVSFTIRPIRPIIMGDTSICSGENILLTANEDARSKFIWQTPLGAVTTDTGFIDILFVSPSHSGFYAVSQSLNGCKSVLSDSIYITVNALPPNPTFDVLPNPVCFGSDFELKAPNYQNMLYVWSGPDNFTSTLPNPKIVNASQEKSGAYSLYISSNGCRSMDSSIVEVIVMPEITTPEPVVQSFDICDTDPLFPRICINPITVHLGSTNVLYDVNGQEVVKTQDNCFDIPPNYIWQNGSNYFYIRASIGNCQSSASQSIVVNKNAPPNIKATALNSDLVVCPNENIQLTAVHDSPSISYNWFSGDENIQFSAPNSRTTFVSGIDDGINVAYLSYSSVGCRDYSIDTIYILKEITPTAVNDVFTIGYDNIVTLPVLQNDDILANGQLVSVTVNVGNAEINNNEIVYTPDIAGIQEVVMTYTICSEFCELCDEASVTLHYDDDIACRVPNIITPNGDGINDELLIPCLLNAKYEANTLTIFNEWGNEVYQSSPYKNDWQGTYKNEALPVGTYFYILEINGIAKPINGFLIIQK
ncbi:MAG: gliding motility-associated C-terminal domain-containing protein [Saprospiraceae bacterium]